jgi:hypothetical protein
MKLKAMTKPSTSAYGRKPTEKPSGETSSYEKNKSVNSKKQSSYVSPYVSAPSNNPLSLNTALIESDKLSQDPYAFIKNIPKEKIEKLGMLRKQQEQKENEKYQNSPTGKLETAASNVGNTILRYHPISLAAQYAAKKVLQNRISENIDPFSYNEENQGWVEKGYKSIFSKSKGRKETEMLASMGGFKNKFGQPSDEPRLRLDLLNMYSGKPQQYNSFSESNFKPTIGVGENEKFFDSKSLKNEVYNLVSKNAELQQKNLSFNNKEELKKKIFSVIGGKIGKSGENMSTTIPALGEGALGVGEDAKGVYISYSDKWDLNPSEGVSADYKTQNSSLKNTLGFALKKAEEFGVVTPPKVYGRIYLDKKTGLPIKD